jgi:hypothetical protein
MPNTVCTCCKSDRYEYRVSADAEAWQDLCRACASSADWSFLCVSSPRLDFEPVAA